MKLEMLNKIIFLMLICFIKINAQNRQVILQPKLKDQPPKVLNDEQNNKNNDPVAKIQILEPKNSTNSTNIVVSTLKPEHEKKIENINAPDNGSPQIESGAVIRGVLVIVGISMLFIIYLGCKTYRKKKSNIIIRKYGVRTRRSDVEMRPLPLDDEEEDETVFDVGNLNKS